MPAFALDSRRPALTGVRLQAAVHEMGASAQHPHDDPTRSIFCNRTLNLRSIRAIGFDMDYTLIEYNVMAWEGKAYEYGAPPAQGIPIPPTACMHRHRFPGANYPTRGCIVYPVLCRVTQCLLQHQLLLQKKAPAKKKKK